MAGMERVRATLVQYGILSPNPAKCSQELMLMETNFTNRVTTIKGKLVGSIVVIKKEQNQGLKNLTVF